MAGFSVSSQGFGQNLLLSTGSLAFTHVYYSCCGRSVSKYANITGFWLAWFGMAIPSQLRSDAIMADFGLW
jgi:hypothetical protein